MSVLFPGSFDPFTRGHEDIVRRALLLFGRVVIAVGYNMEKKSLITVENRVRLICDIFNNEPNVEVISYFGLTTDLCHKLHINNVLRGVRSLHDFEYESTIESINKTLYPDIETIILLSKPGLAPISSSAVREIYHHGGPLEKFMSEGIELEKYI